MANNQTIVKISILDREYPIKCDQQNAEALQRSAKHLDEHMKKIAQNNATMPMERLAIVAALNISNELLQLKTNTTTQNRTLNKQLDTLQQKINAALAAQPQTEDV